MPDARRETVRLIREDAKADAKRYDGMPLTGDTVGEAFGNTLAMIAALADIVDTILDANDV